MNNATEVKDVHSNEILSGDNANAGAGAGAGAGVGAVVVEADDAMVEEA